MLKIKISHFFLKDFALRNINFSLNQGQILGVLGLNGSGKTTLLKAIAGIYALPEGSRTWNGGKWREDLVEYIPPFVQPGLSILTRYFLEASLEKLRIDQKDRNRLERIARILGISDLLDRDMRCLSSGEMTKVLLARALLRKMPVILWDEPTSFLDLRYRIFLKKLLSKIRHKKIFIISTHDLKWLQSLADFYIGLKKGSLLFFSSRLEKEKIKKLLI